MQDVHTRTFPQSSSGALFSVCKHSLWWDWAERTHWILWSSHRQHHQNTAIRHIVPVRHWIWLIHEHMNSQLNRCMQMKLIHWQFMTVFLLWAEKIYSELLRQRFVRRKDPWLLTALPADGFWSSACQNSFNSVKKMQGAMVHNCQSCLMPNTEKILKIEITSGQL